MIAVPAGLVKVRPGDRAARRSGVPASTRTPISLFAPGQVVSTTMPALASAAHERLSKTVPAELQKCDVVGARVGRRGERRARRRSGDGRGDQSLQRTLTFAMRE